MFKGIIKQLKGEKKTMLLAVIYLLPGDNHSDSDSTAYEVFLDFGNQFVIIATAEATNRAGYREALGKPKYDAIRGEDNYRDVDIWEIKSV